MMDIRLLLLKTGEAGAAELTPELASAWKELYLSMPGQYSDTLTRFALTEQDILNDPLKSLGHILKLSASRGKHGLPQRICFALVGSEVVGLLSIRLELNRFLKDLGGHIGYSVKPQWRNKGVARAMLAHARTQLPELGLKRALLTTDPDNIASQKVIAACGGREVDGFHDQNSGKAKKRYWISAFDGSAQFMQTNCNQAIEESLVLLEKFAASKFTASKAVDPYWPKWSTPWWHICFLMEAGLLHLVPRDIVAAFANNISDHYLHFFPFLESEVPQGFSPRHQVLCHCALATVLNVLVEANFEIREEFPWVEQWASRYSLGNGHTHSGRYHGYNCDEAVYLKECGSPSFVGTTCFLEVFAKSLALGDNWGREIARGSCRWLLDRHFSKSLSKGTVADPDFLNFLFPRAYEYDTLRGRLAVLEFAIRDSEFCEEILSRPDFADTFVNGAVFRDEAVLPPLNLLGRRTIDAAQEFERLHSIGQSPSRPCDIPLILKTLSSPENQQFFRTIELARCSIISSEMAQKSVALT
jgi:predicted acetyltransferase